MYCDNCGTLIDPASKVCHGCGYNCRQTLGRGSSIQEKASTVTKTKSLHKILLFAVIFIPIILLALILFRPPAARIPSATENSLSNDCSDGYQPRSDDPLLAAAKVGDAATVKGLIAKGADPNRKDDLGVSALMLAAGCGIGAVQALLEAGADANAEDPIGITALMWAATTGRTPIVRVLLDAGANVNATNHSGTTSLMQAANRETVKTLLDRGAEVNATDRDGVTALMWAAIYGRTDAVRLLLERGADSDAKTTDGRSTIGGTSVSKGDTARTLAIKAGHSDIVPLLARAEANQQNELTESPLGRDDRSPIIKSVPTKGGYVNDFAETITAGDKAKIANIARRLERDTTVQLMVVTVNSTKPESIETYAIRLATAWDIDQKGKPNGILLLLAVKDRKVRIEVAFGLQQFLPNAETQNIINDRLIPHFKKGNYSLGLLSGTEAIYAQLLNEMVSPASIKSDLRNAATAEEAFYSRNRKYVTRVEELPGYNPSRGVELRVDSVEGSFIVLSARRTGQEIPYWTLDSRTGAITLHELPDEATTKKR
jgi:ankyrin repeat protein